VIWRIAPLDVPPLGEDSFSAVVSFGAGQVHVIIFRVDEIVVEVTTLSPIVGSLNVRKSIDMARAAEKRLSLLDCAQERASCLRSG
jgi:hypothetical protein